MNKINIFSLGGLQTIVKKCAYANLSFYEFFFHKNERGRSLWKKNLMHLRTTQLKWLLLGVLWGIRQSCLCSLPRFGQLKRLAVSFTLAFLNELFSILQEICVQRTLVKNYSWYCVFVLYCIVLHFNASFANVSFTFFLPSLDQNAINNS